MIKIIQDKSTLTPDVLEAFNRAELFGDGSPRCVVIPLAEVKHLDRPVSVFDRKSFAVHWLVGPNTGKQELFTTPEFLREFGKH